MKKLIILIILISTSAFTQDIKKEVDDFTGDTTISLLLNKMSGGSFLVKKHGYFDVISVKNGTKNNLFINISLTVSGTNFSLKSNVAGKSLMVKVDDQISEFADNGQTSYEPNIQYDFTVCNANYVTTIDFLTNVSTAKAVKVRLVSSDNTYVDFEFDEDNFKWLKKFVKKINK